MWTSRLVKIIIRRSVGRPTVALQPFPINCSRRRRRQMTEAGDVPCYQSFVDVGAILMQDDVCRRSYAALILRLTSA